MTAKKLVLLDGHALAYRAFYALPLEAFATQSGEPTNATYGFAATLLGILQQHQPDFVGVSFDAGMSGRDELYAEYKGHRERMPDELQLQMERIRETVEAFGFPIFEVPGVEADDVLGTLAQQASEMGVETLIVTGDRDLLQLVTPTVKVFLSGRRLSEGKVYDEQAVQERFGGLSPEQLRDYKALVGDKSDNIPGVTGIGDKTATKLLTDYGSLQSAIDHLEEIEPARFRNALEKGKEDAYLSQKLVTIQTSVPVELDLERCKIGNYDRSQVVKLFRELEFRTLVDRLPSTDETAEQLPLFQQQTPERVPTTTAHTVTQTAELSSLVEQLSHADTVAFDVETTSTDPMHTELVGLGLTDREKEGWYIPVGHQHGTQLPLDQVLEAVRPLLENPALPKQAHNSKFDLSVLRQYDIELKGLAFDTMIAEWLTNPASRNLGLKNLALVRLGVEMTPIQDLIGSGRTQITMAKVDIDRAAAYTAADVDMTYRLAQVLETELREKDHWDLFQDMEIPLVEVILAMEEAGVMLDIPFLNEMSTELAQRLDELSTEIEAIVGHPFNINSTQQMAEALFGTLGISTKGVRRTPTGRYSVAAGVLESLKGTHPVIELILEYRELAKLKSTYVDALPDLVNPDTGRVHTSYKQTGTVTGRISSSSPNLQNIPIRSPLGRRVRRGFIAQPGWLLLGADYSQVELRVLAHICGDEGLLSAFQRGEDIHATTAAAVFDIELDQVTSEQRRFAKQINFGLLYGMSSYRLARETNLTQAEAENFVKQYFGRFPKVQMYLENTIAQAKNQGYVETLLGRRRYFPVLQSTAPGQVRAQQRAGREAINTPIQGSAADIIKRASLDLYRALREQGFQAQIIIQIHDELVLEVPEEELSAVSRLVQDVMESAYPLRAPLMVELTAGPNWGEMKPLAE